MMHCSYSCFNSKLTAFIETSKDLRGLQPTTGGIYECLAFQSMEMYVEIGLKLVQRSDAFDAVHILVLVT